LPANRRARSTSRSDLVARISEALDGFTLTPCLSTNHVIHVDPDGSRRGHLRRRHVCGTTPEAVDHHSSSQPAEAAAGSQRLG
jgi:hypothetical protein